jgi:hypothetical protein
VEEEFQKNYAIEELIFNSDINEFILKELKEDYNCPFHLSIVTYKKLLIDQILQNKKEEFTNHIFQTKKKSIDRFNQIIILKNNCII